MAARLREILDLELKDVRTVYDIYLMVLISFGKYYTILLFAIQFYIYATKWLP